MSGEKKATFRAIDDELQKEDSGATPSGTEGVERKDDVMSFVGQNADLEDVDSSFEESSTSSSETDLEHEEQLGMSLKNLPGNLMSSQQGHFEQVAQSTKNYPDSVEAIRALKTQLGGLSWEISKKLQSTGVNGTNSSCANGWEHTGAKPKSTVPGAPSSSVLDNKVLVGNGWEHTGAEPKSTVPGAHSSSVLDNKVLVGNGWEHTGAKPKSTVPGAPSSSVLDNKVLAGQSHVKDIHEQLGSGGGLSIGFSLHGASNGSLLRDETSTLKCALPSPEHGGQHTTAHGPHQFQETPKLSLEPEYVDMESMSSGANEWNGLPHETPACGINPAFLARHSTDPLLGGYTASNAEASNSQSHVIQLEQNEVHCIQHNMPSEQDDIVRWSSVNIERERIARRWCSCYRDDPDSMPICEVCYRHRYCGPGYHPLMNRVDLCCHCFEEVIGQCIMLPCGHKAHKDCVIAAICFNMLNCSICGKDFLRLA